VRERYDRGVFYDCRSPAVVFQLLRIFFRELPSPLLPSSMYPEAIAIVTDHVHRCLAELRKTRLYKSLLAVHVRGATPATVDGVDPRNNEGVPFRGLLCTQGAETDTVVDAMWAAALGTGPVGGGSGGSTSPASANSTRPPTPAGAATAAGGSSGGGGSGAGALSPSESASSMDLAVLYDGPVSEAVTAVQAVVCDYAFSLRAPLPDLEELFFRVIKPHRNTLEYLGVACAKLELAYARALAREQAAGSGGDAGAGTLLPPSLVFDLAAAFAPYIIRPAVWGATQDTHAKKRAKFLQHRFVLLFWYFLKRKHNLVTRAERNDLNRNSHEVPDTCAYGNQVAEGTHQERVRGTLCASTDAT